MTEESSSKTKPLARNETRELGVKTTFLEGLARRDPHQAAAALKNAPTLGYRQRLVRDHLYHPRQHPLYRSIPSKVRKMKVGIA